MDQQIGEGIGVKTVEETGGSRSCDSRPKRIRVIRAACQLSGDLVRRTVPEEVAAEVQLRQDTARNGKVGLYGAAGKFLLPVETGLGGTAKDPFLRREFFAGDTVYFSLLRRCEADLPVSLGKNALQGSLQLIQVVELRE